MYNSNQMKQPIRAVIPITRSLKNWLGLDIGDLGLIFSFSIKTHNGLKAMGFEKLSDLLLFSRKGLVAGTGLTKKEFDELSWDDRRRILEMEERAGAKE